MVRQGWYICICKVACVSNVPLSLWNLAIFPLVLREGFKTSSVGTLNFATKDCKSMTPLNKNVRKEVGKQIQFGK